MLRKATSPSSSHTMTPWGSVSRARRRRMASELASVTASAASPVTRSRCMSTESKVPSSGGSTPSRLDRAVSRCWSARRPDRRPCRTAIRTAITATAPSAMYPITYDFTA